MISALTNIRPLPSLHLLQHQWHVSDKLSILFEPRHVRCIHSHYVQ